MRVTSTVVLALIAGILSCASAQSDVSKLESLCVKNGGPTAWADVETSGRNAKSCMTSMVVALMEEYQTSSGDINAVLAEYCRRVQTLITCFESFLELVKTCMDPGHELLLNVTIDTIAPTLQFPCAHTKLIREVIESTDRPCLMSKRHALHTCSENIMNNSSTTSPDLAVTGINTHEIVPELEPGLDSKLCSEILTFEECAVGVLEECEDKIFSTTLNSMYKYINDHIPCENLPKTSKSESSTSGSVVNVL